MNQQHLNFRDPECISSVRVWGMQRKYICRMLYKILSLGTIVLYYGPERNTSLMVLRSINS